MNPSLRTWVVPLIAALSFAGLLAWQYRVATVLRQQIDHERKNVAGRTPLRPEAAAPLTASVETRDKRAIEDDDDEAAIARLRKEIDGLKTRAATRSRKDAASTAPEVAVPSMTKEMLPVEQWRQAGHATPAAALETVLWAAAAGDVDALAASLSIDPVVRTKVNGLLGRLPENIRKEYDTPERLMALLTASDVPLGAAQIHEVDSRELGGTSLVAVLRDTENRHRGASVTLRQEGDAWKLVVPGTAVEKYAAMLSGGSAK